MYSYKVVATSTADNTCSAEQTVTLTLSTPQAPILICQDTTNHAELIAQSELTGVVWYNSSDAQVGTGTTLLVDATTSGMEDGTDSYYYSAEDGTGCEVGLCCPIVVTTEDCCKPNICLPFTVTIRRGKRN